MTLLTLFELLSEYRASNLRTLAAHHRLPDDLRLKDDLVVALTKALNNEAEIKRSIAALTERQRRILDLVHFSDGMLEADALRGVLMREKLITLDQTRTSKSYYSYKPTAGNPSATTSDQLKMCWHCLKSRDWC